MEFILNNLECLEVGGTCIAIVPMSCALATSGTTFELKKKLLSKHTLEAVLSMPDELFFNSKTNVVTCIMIFTAHKPHSKEKKTYFGYYKDDGFIKRKVQKRHDGLGKWEKIKEKWVNSFINKEVESNFSVVKAVEAKDEWCAEAYMETDYSKLNQSFFEQTIKNYLLSSIQNGKI